MAKNKKTEAASRKVVAENRKARRDYEILDSWEGGIVLLGSEVKSIRQGAANLKESYIRFENGECYLVGCHISPYKFSSAVAYDPLRPRKIMLHKREIERLAGQVKQKGLTVVPLKLYFNARGRCKLDMGLGRGKKLYDKREDVKAKEAARQMERAFKR